MSCDHVMFFQTVLAIMSGGYDPNVPQPPRILQCPIVKDFLSQPVSEGFLLAFRFDLVFQFVEMLGRSEQHDVFLDLWGQPIPITL